MYVMLKSISEQSVVHRCYGCSGHRHREAGQIRICHSIIGQNIGEATASTALGCYI